MKTTIKILLLFSFLLGIFISPNEIIAQPNQAKVYIIRSSVMGAAIKFPLVVNDMQLEKLGAKKYIECVVPAGEVTIATVSEKNDEIKFVAETGEKYYVLVNISMGIVTGRAKLAQLNASEGEKLVSKLKQQQFADLINPAGSTSSSSFDELYAQNTSIPDQQSAPILQPTTVQPTMPQTNNVVATSGRPNSDVDINIPIAKTSSDNTFVLIIANENYEFVDDVQFALNDGEIFREYCIKTLGVPERQVWLYKNASLGIIAGGVDKMVQAMNIFDETKAIIYYCGHGIPDEKTGDAYIIPVDGRGTNTATCYSLNQLYKTMASAKTSNVTYFMDACFTGANRDGSMLVAARGVAREAKKEVITGNTVVFSAASGDETAMPFKEKNHGLFTYFLLKKLQETQGNVTYGELAEYINKNVKKEAFLTNEKPQNPVVATSAELENKWKNVSIK